MNEVSQLFDARAGAYASFRPHYPAALFDWLSRHCRDHQRALDLACGNGQASQRLPRYFTRVLASDASLGQLRAAGTIPGVSFYAASAETQPLADASLDLIVVAQALHWFAGPAFFAEVARLLKPGGLFCAWCYSLMSIDERLDPLIDAFYRETLKDYWPQGRASVDAGYRDIQMPFARIEAPTFAIEAHWHFDHLTGYLRTWSAVQRWERQHGRDPVSELIPQLRQAWGDGEPVRLVRWPLHLLTGIRN
ncbi:class I SAM-dependent methyltransferase [Pseudomonas zhanjiangensis]|uniref:Class I SAM-dependent methyltransferase n=1 Tax=Pseudomonas zhanjiangensis TaxID=3239015 RepID=A0ABV3YXB9_9PSED